MKKLLGILFILVFISFPIKQKAIVTNSSYNMSVYVFYKDNCENCDKAKEWLENKLKDNYLVNAVYMNIDNNKELIGKIKNALNIKKDKYPLIVIGTNYFVGFKEKTSNEIYKAIEAYSKSADTCDIVTKLQSGKDIKDCISQNKNIYKNKSPFVVVIVSIILLILIGIVIFFSKKIISSRLRK